MLTCKQFNNLISAYLNDELTEAEKAAMDAHKNICSSCAQELRFAESVHQTLHSLPRLSATPEFKLELDKRLDEIDQGTYTPPEAFKKRKFEFIYDWKKYSAVAACAVLAVLIGLDPTGLLRRSQVDTDQFADIPAVTDSGRIGTPADDRARQSSHPLPIEDFPVQAALPSETSSPQRAEKPAGDISDKANKTAKKAKVQEASANRQSSPSKTASPTAAAKNRSTASPEKQQTSPPAVTAKPPASPKAPEQTPSVTQAPPTSAANTAAPETYALSPASLDQSTDTPMIAHVDTDPGTSANEPASIPFDNSGVIGDRRTLPGASDPFKSVQDSSAQPFVNTRSAEPPVDMSSRSKSYRLANTNDGAALAGIKMGDAINTFIIVDSHDEQEVKDIFSKHLTAVDGDGDENYLFMPDGYLSALDELKQEGIAYQNTFNYVSNSPVILKLIVT